MGGGGKGLLFFAGLRGGGDEGIGRFGAFGCPCFALARHFQLERLMVAALAAQLIGLPRQGDGKDASNRNCCEQFDFVGDHRQPLHHVSIM